MKDFAKKIIDGNRVTPPEICLPAFHENFPGAINVDWFIRGKHFEAIFYKDSIEHIARYDKKGKLEEYKMTLTPSLLPELIKNKLEMKGEIMNVLLINKGNCLNYEAIIRDENLNRHLVLFSNLGKILSENAL